ncbi:MAG: redoxin domain-containing protein, partial [Spirochaetales bacterium]|nr:redoxin domain-containing protein [Spirochaetales bacterium]
EWFNFEKLGIGENDGTVNIEDFRGKVVLVDFWTYSCINCVRTIPHIRAWYEAYSDQGLVIIGVHTPEFVFERSASNVQKAMDDLGVTWPVVLDNSFQQWRAYNNRYWPAKYFIDAEGRIRYFHFGEGEYDTSEKVIRALLDEAGGVSKVKAAAAVEQKLESRTAEAYLGFSRSTGFASEEEQVRNQATSYQAAKVPGNGEWTLSGTWTVKGEYIVPDERGILELGFNAKNVFLVVETIESEGSIVVNVDGRPVEDTPDVVDGVLRADESRLYQLVGLPKPGKHILELKVEGNLRLFAFTFG